MMATLLLIIIYAAFISLGLPDSLLGSAWPEMYAQLQVPQSSAGILSMIISGGTILSSLLCERMIRRFGTAAITVVSVSMTAAALLGFSLSGHFGLLCLVAIPLGLGAGAIDSALNNFVALHLGNRRDLWAPHYVSVSGKRRRMAQWLRHHFHHSVGPGGHSGAFLATLETIPVSCIGSTNHTDRPAIRTETARCSAYPAFLFLLLCSRSHDWPVGQQLFGG